jgi:hypothetical protein
LGATASFAAIGVAEYTHEDAEVIAATVAGMPDSLSGKRIAIRVAELARAGLTPNWMPGAVPRCVPAEIKRTRHGDRTLILARHRDPAPPPLLLTSPALRLAHEPVADCARYDLLRRAG